MQPLLKRYPCFDAVCDFAQPALEADATQQITKDYLPLKQLVHGRIAAGKAIALLHSVHINAAHLVAWQRYWQCF
jgi:hypothetical protein